MKIKILLEYTRPHMSQLNVVIVRIFAIIKYGVLYMLLNSKLNNTYHKMLWSEVVHMCKLMHNSTETTI